MDAERLDDQCSYSYSWYSLFAIRRDHRTTAFVRIFMGRPAGSRVPPPRFHHHLARYIKYWYSTFSPRCRCLLSSRTWPGAHVAGPCRSPDFSPLPNSIPCLPLFQRILRWVAHLVDTVTVTVTLVVHRVTAGRSRPDLGALGADSLQTVTVRTHRCCRSLTHSLAHSLTHSLAPTSHQTS